MITHAYAALSDATLIPDLSNIIITLAFIGVISLATVAFFVALTMVMPEIARALRGKPASGQIPLSLRRRLGIGLSLALGIFGAITEGIGLITHHALMSDGGLALVISALVLVVVSAARS